MAQTEPAGRCDFLDVLEEAARFKKPVMVELRDGLRFRANVQDVVTDGGEDYAVFDGRGRVPVSDIARCGSTLDHDPHSYDEKL